MTHHRKEQSSNFFSPLLSPEEQKRLDRQLRLPGLRQSIIKQSKVLIVGVGGLGTEVAKNLAALGVGTIYLCDMDYIEYSNLNRQILFIEAKEGESKAVAAAKFLRKINPFGKYIPLQMRLEEIPPEIYKEVDLIISGLDSAQSRINLNRRCFFYQKPLLDGGTRNYYGHVYTIWYGKNACLECDPLRDPQREDLAACSLVGKPRKRSHCALKAVLKFQKENNRLPDINTRDEIIQVTAYANKLIDQYFPHESPFSIDEIIQLVDHHEPAIITINSIIAAIQSHEALKILHHLKGAPLGVVNLDYLIYNGLNSSFYKIERKPNPKCQLCGENSLPLLKVRIQPQRTFQELLVRLKKRGYQIDSDVLITRIEAPNLEMIEFSEAIGGQGIINGEILLISGTRAKNHSNTEKNEVLLQIYFHKSESMAK